MRIFLYTQYSINEYMIPLITVTLNLIAAIIVVRSIYTGYQGWLKGEEFPQILRRMGKKIFVGILAICAAELFSYVAVVFGYTGPSL